MSFSSISLISTKTTKSNEINDLYGKEKNNKNIEHSQQKKNYYVYWPIKNNSYNLDNKYFIDKNQPFIKNIVISNNNLKSIKFNLIWEDDLTLKNHNFGKDILKLTIINPDGKKIYNEKSVGNGFIEYEINNINKKPTIDKIISENIQNAYYDLLTNDKIKWKNEPIILIIKIQIGELNPLRRKIDLGNEIFLDITYEYYSPEISEKIDNLPDTNIVVKPPNIISNESVVISWTAVDDYTELEKIEYSYKLSKEENWSPWSKETKKVYEGLKNGNYKFSVKSKDHRGNIDQSPAICSFIFKNDMNFNKPDTIITAGPKGIIGYKDITFKWIGYDDKTPSDDLFFSYFLEGKDNTWSHWCKNKSIKYFDLSNGQYTFHIRAMDDDGNIDSTPSSQNFIVEFVVDTKSPNTIIINSPSNKIDYNNIIFNWSGSDDITQVQDLLYSYKLVGFNTEWSEFTDSTSKTYNGLINGEYTFNVKAKDISGNVDESPAQKNFIVKVETGPNRYVSKIIEFNIGENQHPSYTDSFKVLKGPKGLGRDEGSLDVLSLGVNGSIILGFDVKITNGPGNDFIVFENPLYKYNSDKVYAELMFVEVSTDGTNYVRFPSISKTTKSGIIYPNDVINLAGVNPVYANVDKNDINPYDPIVAGGDAFDLDILFDDSKVKSGLVDIDNINYIKLIDIKGDGSSFDSRNNPIYDATDMDNGADLDAIAVINYKIK